MRKRKNPSATVHGLWITCLLLAPVPVVLQPVLRAVFSTPERNYEGVLGVRVSGIFHKYMDRGELVFWLATDNESLRLIFYCNPQDASTGNLRTQPGMTGITDVNMTGLTTITRDPAPLGMIVQQWEFCTESGQVPLREGQNVKLMGTLIWPFDWTPELSERNMRFDADLYVTVILSPP